MMIVLRQEITIPSPPDEGWPLLRDPPVVASCIPGATLTSTGEGGASQGTLHSQFGDGNVGRSCILVVQNVPTESSSSESFGIELIKR